MCIRDRFSMERPKLTLEFDTLFEHEVTVSEAGGRKYVRLTIRKKKAKELGLKGGELVRIAIQKGDKISVVEKRVQAIHSNGSTSLRINIPKETVEYLLLKNGDTVKAYIKILS